MTSEDKLLAAGWDRQSPLPENVVRDTPAHLGDVGAGSRGTPDDTGLIFVTQKDSRVVQSVATPEGVVLLSSRSDDARQEELWKKLESVMLTRQSNVQAVMEEFGIADVPPASDELEEQLWQVVEGELTLQEAADLV